MSSLREFLETNNFKRIALRKLNSNHFQLSARINGVKGVFILDTGASNSCIGLDKTERFKLKTQESEIKASGAGATNMYTLISEANTLAIGGWKKRNVDFVIFDLVHVNAALLQAEVNEIDGIIGADVLKSTRAVIDYGRNCLYLK